MIRMPPEYLLPMGGFLGTSYWIPWADPEVAERNLYFLWTGSALGSQGGTGECLWGEEYLGFHPESVAFATQPWI